MLDHEHARMAKSIALTLKFCLAPHPFAFFEPYKKDPKGFGLWGLLISKTGYRFTNFSASKAILVLLLASPVLS
jgi:hypothetical protein